MKAASDLLSNLLLGLRELKDALLDAESCGVQPSTHERLAELSALRASSLVETFLEELFLSCLLGTSGIAGIEPAMNASTRHEAELLLFASGERRERYLDWLPYKTTLDRAESLLVNGEPFTRIQYRQVKKRALQELTIIRNAVAHPSEHAGKEFHKLADQKKYSALTAGQYLLSLRSGDPEILLLLTRLELLSSGIAATEELQAGAFFEPEEPFNPNVHAPRGTYECQGCQGVAVLAQRSVLKDCAECLKLTNCVVCGSRNKVSPKWRRLRP